MLNIGITITHPVTMMGLVKFVRDSDLESIKKPVLVIYSPNDQGVNSEVR